MRAGYLHTRANYQLCVDIILNLSHADFLNPASLGGGATTRARSKVIKTGTDLHLSWNMKDEVPLPVIGREYPGRARLDPWMDVTWTPPGIMYMEAGGGDQHLQRAHRDAGRSRDHQLFLLQHAQFPSR